MDDVSDWMRSQTSKFAAIYLAWRYNFENACLWNIFCLFLFLNEFTR